MPSDIPLSPVFLFLSVLFSCKEQVTFFQEIPADHSGIYFNNRIIENDSINQLDIGNVFNGAGVGIGDFNHDGLPDIYFTGNLVSCKLYLNKGDFVFKDVTNVSEVSGEGKWCSGVAVVDINNDGNLDLYLCTTLSDDPVKRRNLLYINQGSDKENIPHFKEMASEYGLDDDSQSTQASFFDFDNDGDNDMYLVVNEINDRISPYLFHPIIQDGSNPSTGKLFRNDWNNKLNHPVFKNISKQAGIQTEGYGNAASILDINQDGWKDIYVSNDYFSNDLLWINNQDGTFSEKCSSYFKHLSAAAMGNDVGDINNDGLVDIITLDMNPEDNYRKKMMLSPNSYQLYQNTERFGYSHQYVRNTLQLNQGPVGSQHDSIMNPVFSEVGYYAGIEATDWSWTPLLTDLDNDGYRDLFIANGFPRDITDHDFGMYRSKAYLTASKSQILMQIPEVKMHNYIFRNNADLTFTDVSDNWGMATTTFSSGAAYADLDTDGDLDLVINNTNGEASLYRNNAREQNKDNHHYLQIQLHGDAQNIQGLGAWIEVYYDHGKRQVWEYSPFKGYLSTSECLAHFGLGQTSTLDSILVKWQNGKMHCIYNIPANQRLKISMAIAALPYRWTHKNPASNSLFQEVTHLVNIRYAQQETDFVDFNIQKLLPHKFSEYGPALAVGDLDGNGLDDLICGGSANYSARIFLQRKDGTFMQKALLFKVDVNSKSWDDAGILVFDAEGDGDQDLWISSGGYENEPNADAFQDHFYINDGKGNYTEYADAIPRNNTSKSCVRAADFDRDGDLDLFIAGRVDPWHYPRPVSSYIYRNDSKIGQPEFVDVTQQVAPDLIHIGLVCDALFTDFNNDGWLDLMLAGEWMPLTMLMNDRGIFKDITAGSGAANETGWWNTISAGDFDHDGDMDYIAGNLGLNSFYRADPQHPVSIYSSDFDNNGSYDAFTSIFLMTSQQDTSRREFPVHGRDDVIKQMIGMRSKFQNFKSYAVSTMEQLFSEEQIEVALKLNANNFSSSYCRNDGNNRFTLFPLPVQAQFSVLNGMTVDDYNADGNLDVLISGNDFGTEVSTGRYDALNGLLLRGNGHGEFSALTISESGIFIPGNGKALVKLRSGTDRYLVAAGQNRGPIKIFNLRRKVRLIPVMPDDIAAEIKRKNGTSYRQEFYYGCSFLSQSARFLVTDSLTESVIMINNLGNKREIPL